MLKFLFDPTTKVLLKSRVSDGRLRMYYGDVRDTIECIGVRERPIHKKIKVNKSGKLDSKEKSKPAAKNNMVSVKVVPTNGASGKYEQGNNQYANMVFASSLHLPNRVNLDANNKYLMFEDPKSAGAFVVIVVHQYIPAGLKSLNDARGSVMSDYQTFLEREWVNTLMGKYPIQVDQQVFMTLKARMVRP